MDEKTFDGEHSISKTNVRDGGVRYLAFIGPPGSGKTTQIELLQTVIAPDALVVASVPRLIRQQADLLAYLTGDEREELNALVDLARQARECGNLAPIRHDELLFEVAARSSGDDETIMVLDGCPRGRPQAQIFLSKDCLAAQTAVVQLYFPEQEVASSLARQYARECRKRGEAAAQARRHVFQRKLEIYLRDTLPGIALLASAGVPVIRLAATLPSSEVHERVLTLLEQR